MATTKIVSERDFRKPEYRDAKTEDYEFRQDGTLARKDRWETGIGDIRRLVGIDARSFEISDVVNAVRTLVNDEVWHEIGRFDHLPNEGGRYDVKFDDGSIIIAALYDTTSQKFSWEYHGVLLNNVMAWRESNYK